MWQVGLCPGEKVVWRETALRRHSRALVTLITHSPDLRFLSRLFHTWHEDNGTRGQRSWICGTTGFWAEINIVSHDAWSSIDIQPVSIDRRFDYRRHFSQDNQLQPRDPEDAVWGTLISGLFYLVLQTLEILNLCYIILLDTT